MCFLYFEPSCRNPDAKLGIFRLAIRMLCIFYSFFQIRILELQAPLFVILRKPGSEIQNLNVIFEM
jgi:hypothetical protein